MASQLLSLTGAQIITEPSKNIHLGMVFSGRLIIDLHEGTFSRKMVLFPTATKYGARASWKKKPTNLPTQ